MTAAIPPVTGCVHRLGDNVDTDAILPGRYLALRDENALGAHCLESHDPGFRQRVKPGDILVAGRNFGCGSSREHAVIALKAAGIRAIVAASVARIFFRNAINLGVPVLISAEAAVGLEAGRAARIIVPTGEIQQDGRSWQAKALSGEAAAILACGGLMERTRQILSAGATNYVAKRPL
jgi:3-isopropylmalate/(R)-2-methylmalate dehydratase small subunit